MEDRLAALQLEGRKEEMKKKLVNFTLTNN